MKRAAAFLLLFVMAFCAMAQGDAAQKAKAAALFDGGKYSEALPLYSQLVSLTPSDHDLNYRLGTCMVHGGGDKDKAVGFLRFAVQGAGITPRAHYEYGQALQVTYRFNDALAEYAKYKATADKRMLAERPTEAVEKQCRNGTQLLSNLKEIEVHNKVEVDRTQFDRFYDLTDMGGRIIAVPEELMSALDKKSGERSFLFKPDKGGTIYFSSYGKDGKTGRDIYSTELLPNGTFAVPRKLAGYINTDQDEDFPYLHPDGKSFYFCSKGHTSMGGYDVFRSTYDRGLDVFGSPENLDFAVNTPDDDMLYIVDPEGKEACFASSRESKQGQVHVYRVSTAQQPLALVILKGQYLSEIDAGDRKAHIVVEDAVTRQQVADVRTGLDGTYVLSLPRSGKYKFMVEAGPGGRTHVGMVEAPRVDGARAYRQELILQNPGGQEKLLIKNYFDEPLPDDLIALALDEIKRRAKLDMTATAPVAQAPVEDEPVGDVMTRAGFAGNITTTQAVQLAAEDARELTASAQDLKDQSEAAYTAALRSAAEAERANTAAAQHIRNADAATDDAVKNTEMTEAARERERARTAGLRAKAAMRAGEDLEAEALARQQQAVNAERLSTDLAAAVNAKNDATTVQHLTKLKERVDVKTGPNAEVAAHERTRRAMVEKEAEASRALQAAATKRDEETDVVASINRLERERDQTKSKGKKDEITQQITQLNDQLAAMRTETERAFAKAKGAQNETAVMRSQSALMKSLDDGAAPMTGTEMTAAQRGELGQRVATIEMSTAALPIDERFEAAIAEEVERQRAVANDWSTGGASVADNGSAAPTAVRNVDGIDRLATQRTEAQRADLDKQTTGDRAVGTVTQPAGSQENAGSATTTTADGANTANGEDDGSRTVDNAAIGSDVAQTGNTGSTNTASTNGSQVQTTGTAVTDLSTAAQAPVQVPPDSLMPSTPDPGAALVTSPDPAQQRFVVENEIAELEQLRASERNKDERAKLEARIAEAKERLATLSAEAERTEVAETITMQSDTPEVARAAVEFDRTMRDEDLIGKLFTSYTADRDRSLKLTDPVERANAANGLELMLVDSLQAETDRQTTLLELAPQRADELLPRIERLRLMRSAHNAEAERYAREAELAQRHAALAANPEEDYAIDNTATTATRATFSGTEHVDSYVDPTEDRQFMLESPVEFRSSKVKDAVAMREQDIERMVRLEEEIDSLENMLGTMPQGKDYDKLRKKTDKLIDDHMIERTEMGERSGFLSDEEYKHANDSLKSVRTDVAKLGLAPDEPLVQLAKQFEEDARTNFTQAQLLRKRADRTEDIVLRDSLFRTAFGKELEALRGLDQSITVNNYLLGGEHERGQTLTYAEVERRMFGPDEPVLADSATPASGTTRTADDATDSLNVPATGTVEPDVPTSNSITGSEQTQPGSYVVPPVSTTTGNTTASSGGATTTASREARPGNAPGTPQSGAQAERAGVFVEHKYDVLATEALRGCAIVREELTGRGRSCHGTARQCRNRKEAGP
ncbi:MAG: PD40 domain-containing protein [Flavobacteriales bacterium]|nr:MAG: PD40 domain-containing protein [Flavobacteriales bacterium]